MKRTVAAISLVGLLLWRFSSLQTDLPPTPTFDSSTAFQPSYSSFEDFKTQQNENSIIMNQIHSSLDRIIAKQDKLRTTRAHDHQHHSNCAPRSGVIISNTMGRLANNLFEIGFANRLATELCWTVLYRPHWQGEIPNSRATQCFPHSKLPKDHTSLSNIPLSLQKQLQLNDTFWTSVSTKKGNRLFQDWFAERQQDGIALKIHNDGNLFTGDAPNRLVQKIRNESSQIQVISLEAFFIHSDWMRNEWADKIRQWFQMSKDCCHDHVPPDDAVVIHLRDFSPKDETNMGIKPSVYVHIMEEYNLTNRPVWIVCQPSTVGSNIMTDLLNAIPPDNVEIVTGQDQYDAFCTLTKSKTLLLTSASSFSQMAAFLASNATDVHYPLKTLRNPKVTISVPGWKYHLVDRKSLDKVVRFNVDRSEIRFKAA